MFSVTLQGEVFSVYEKTSISDFLKDNRPKVLEQACCAKLNGVVKDLRDLLDSDCELEICTFNSPEGKKAFWHTTAHILAQAVFRLYKSAKFAIGPAIDSGFYYDIKADENITLKDLVKIEAEMKDIVKQNIAIEREFVSYSEAERILANQPYKLELLKDLKNKGSMVSIYRQGEYVDLCAGPHIMRTGKVRAIKLVNVTGAYWRGNAKNEMLDRIYGISFTNNEQLDEYIKIYEASKNIDHRKLGKELELFSFLNEGPGFAFFMPNGITIKNALIDYWRKEHLAAGYREISTPIILSRSLWETSGHWDHYKENMYTTVIDDEDFAIKPMNCPGSILVYKMFSHSYKEFPLRFCELGIVHRHELSGTLHGLMRARCFTQDDAHIFLTKDYIKSEVKNIITLVDKIYKKFGFSYNLELATMPENHIGEVSAWNEATDSLKGAMDELNLSYKINEGDGAFYGPKIDFYLKDSLKRSWQCGTIQLDFQLPKRFNIDFVGSDGQKHTPIMIHRVIYGSIERFIGILTEHFAGAFPFFMAPVQVVILPISDKFLDYAKYVYDKILSFGFRAKLDDRSEKVGYKIRQAGFMKIPFILILGEKEKNKDIVSVRKYKEQNTTEKTLDEFLEYLKNVK